VRTEAQRAPRLKRRNCEFDTHAAATIPALMERVGARLGKAQRLSDLLMLDSAPPSSDFYEPKLIGVAPEYGSQALFGCLSLSPRDRLGNGHSGR
jgi:hypothetical protein